MHYVTSIIHFVVDEINTKLKMVVNNDYTFFKFTCIAHF